jgi:5-methylcytosine-specific restriction enzyme B
MLSQQIRDYVLRQYVQPARKRGEKTVEVLAGDVHRQLGLYNSVPSVCQALRSKKFEQQSKARLLEFSGPPSGLSTTTKFKFEVKPRSDESPEQQPTRAGQGDLERFYGAAKDLYASYGGGEKYLKQERAGWSRGGKSS